MAGQIFISAASADRRAAEKLCAGIEDAGLSCWIASRDIPPGASYSRAILDAIAASRAMIVVLSSKTSDSSHVLREVERAVDRRLPLMPVRVEDARPRDELEYFLSAVQWVDAFPDLRDDVLRRIVGTLRALIGSKPEPISALVSDIPQDIVEPVAAPLTEAAIRLPTRYAWRRWTAATVAVALTIGAVGVWHRFQPTELFTVLPALRQKAITKIAADTSFYDQFDRGERPIQIAHAFMFEGSAHLSVELVLDPALIAFTVQNGQKFTTYFADAAKRKLPLTRVSDSEREITLNEAEPGYRRTLAAWVRHVRAHPDWVDPDRFR